MAGPIFDAAVRFFQEENWRYIQRADWPILDATYVGKNGPLLCRAVALDMQSQFVFYSYPRFLVPPKRRWAVAELFTRINYMLFVGSFEMDFGDGEMRFKTSICIEGKDLNTTLIYRMVYINLTTMDTCLPAITRVALDGIGPEQVVAELQEQLLELFGLR